MKHEHADYMKLKNEQMPLATCPVNTGGLKHQFVELENFHNCKKDLSLYQKWKVA